MRWGKRQKNFVRKMVEKGRTTTARPLQGKKIQSKGRVKQAKRMLRNPRRKPRERGDGTKEDRGQVVRGTRESIQPQNGGRGKGEPTSARHRSGGDRRMREGREKRPKGEKGLKKERVKTEKKG